MNSNNNLPLSTIAPLSPEKLTTAVEIADLLFYLIVVHGSVYNECGRIP